MTRRKPAKSIAEKTVQDIRRATRRKYSAEEKIRMVMEGLRAEESVTEVCTNWIDKFRMLSKLFRDIFLKVVEKLNYGD